MNQYDNEQIVVGDLHIYATLSIQFQILFTIRKDITHCKHSVNCVFIFG